jgi:branched-chain amino acid transport system permease protein
LAIAKHSTTVAIHRLWRIANGMIMVDVLGAITNGIVWGLIVALLALGLVLIFGYLHILNLAHGSLYMLGAVLAFYATSRFRSFVLAAVLVPPVIAALGFVIERWLLRPVRSISNADVMVTFGLAMIIEYVVLVLFGGAPQRVPYPINAFIPIFGSNYPVYRLVVAMVSLLCLVSCTLLLERTRFGLYIRASYQDFELARSLGIPVNWVILLTFGVGSACAAIAGVMTAPLVGVEFRMGVDIVAVSFLVTIIGGLTRIPMITLVAVLTEVAENLLALWLDPILARAMLLFGLFVALLVIYAGPSKRRII